MSFSGSNELPSINFCTCFRIACRFIYHSILPQVQSGSRPLASLNLSTHFTTCPVHVWLRVLNPPQSIPPTPSPPRHESQCTLSTVTHIPLEDKGLDRISILHGLRIYTRTMMYIWNTLPASSPDMLTLTPSQFFLSRCSLDGGASSRSIFTTADVLDLLADAAKYSLPTILLTLSSICISWLSPQFCICNCIIPQNHTLIM